ncbi:MAG: CheR family methyltransferase [Candidatus Omnitrophota bacterium]
MPRKIKVIPKKKQNTPADPRTKSFPVVGIGGSAGGLEAFQELLVNISDKPGMALVFIMHMAQGRKSLLPELLARKTKMPVSEITNGMVPEINHVYIKPSGTNLSMVNGKLTLSAMANEKNKHMPIDYFFRSLADELDNRSIGVVLSGTATDGTLGAGAIKAAGGITFAEDEKSAAFSDMPQSAINSGCVDFVLSPKRIAVELERISKHPLLSFSALFKTDAPIVLEDKGFQNIFDMLRRAKGLDFTYYKHATTARRISRRIILTKQGDFRNYIKFLRENECEIDYLYEDLLINVTNFFRDQKAFHALEKSVIPEILKNATKDQGIRIWVPGCSSGEEAYSIAILVAEALGRNTGVIPVTIFATDMSGNSINKARRGVYGKNIKDTVSPARLKSFFTKEGNSYKVSKSIREMCVFSEQNVFNDPPFSNVDLVSCRNLLIYLQPILQKKTFHNFHYSLKPNGFLFLGNSESIVGCSNLFKVLDRKHKIFVKRYVSIKPKFQLGQRYYPSEKLKVTEKTVIDTGKETDIVDIAAKVVFDEYASCGVC